jgi:Tfp pilus assembly protein PilF
MLSNNDNLVQNNYWLCGNSQFEHQQQYISKGLKVALNVAPANNSQNQIIHQSRFIKQDKKNTANVINPCLRQLTAR